jgi:uncharacterized membrane protein YidH (DUF202 family)
MTAMTQATRTTRDSLLPARGSWNFPHSVDVHAKSLVMDRRCIWIANTKDGLALRHFSGLLRPSATTSLITKKEQQMNNIKIIGIVLIVAGVLGAALGGFSFTRDTHKASLGPINLSVAEEKKVDIPLWASVAAIVAGAAVLAAGSKR